MENKIWYDSLTKPPLAPMEEIFQPVWVFLYTTLFVSFILILFADRNESKAPALSLFFFHLILNFCWYPAFFMMKNILLALIISVLMLITLIVVFYFFWKISKTSVLVLIPYFLWLCFATYLNAGYLILNR